MCDDQGGVLEERQDGERYNEVGRPLSKDRNTDDKFWVYCFGWLTEEIELVRRTVKSILLLHFHGIL